MEKNAPSTDQLKPCNIIFAGRWLLAPLYLGLIPAVGLYVWKFYAELWHMITHLTSVDDEALLLGILHLVDIVMIANLIVVTMIGGFVLFVRELPITGTNNRLRWLDHIDPVTLKLKLGLALVGVSSIQLLEAFMNANSTDWSQLGKLVLIHLVFVLSTMAVAWIGKALKPTQTDTTASGHRGG